MATTDLAFARHANAVLPKRAAITAGLEAFSGAWTQDHAAHLLRRCLFAFTPADLGQALGLTLDACVETLLSPPAETIAPPVVIDATDSVAPGQTWVTADYDGTLTSVRGRSFQDWWLGLMLNQGFSVREKMVVFWHNAMPSEIDVVGDPRYSYYQNALLRANALGNFQTLVRQISTDAAMLRYLNGDTNTNANPNENYGRELQELFTIGKGPEITAGNYTNYTEDDVKAAARVLTGWRDVRVGSTSEFHYQSHDTADKVFSSAYGGVTVKGRTGADGALELDDLISMIFAQTETAKALCRKLYRFFVYYAIDATAEANVIAPLADLLIKNKYEVRPVLAVLLKSAHFHDVNNVGCMIKPPLDVAVGSFRQLAATQPPPAAAGASAADATAAAIAQYSLWEALVGEAARMQQEIGNPPNVAGWPAYYQTPVFYELWINSDTLPRREQLTDKLASAKGYAYGTGKAATVDVIALASATSAPDTIATVVEEMSALLFPIALTDVQLKYLQDTVLGGLPDYEWGVEWNAYTAAPADALKKSAVENKLRALLAAMMEMAEYQLC